MTHIEHMPCKSLRNLIRTTLRALMLRAAFRLAEKAEMHGFDVANLSESSQNAKLFARIEDVLSLILAVDPGLLIRMRRSFRRILVAPGGGASGSYWHFLDGCALAADHLLNNSDASVAMTLVHEATHARLHRAGIVYTIADRARIEAICVRAEIEFGRRLCGAESLIAEAESALSTEWWKPSKQKARAAGQLRTLGVPKWLRKLRR